MGFDDEIELHLITFDTPPPSVIFQYNFFCFTGHFLNVRRSVCEKNVRERGGIVKDNINMVTNYLVIGAGLYELMNKPQMRFNNKMEGALAVRKGGSSIKIISEDHFAKELALENETIKEGKGRSYSIESSSVPGQKYKVSLHALTCTCPNFLEDRAAFSAVDPRRLCKHLVAALTDNRDVPEGLKEHVEKIAIASIYHGGIPGWRKK